MRHAFRSLARTPKFTLTAVLLLAIGIGTNVAVFAFTDALFLRRPNVPDSDRLVGIHGEREREICTYCISYPDYLLHAAATRALTGIALYDLPVWVWHTEGENSRELAGAAVTSNFLDILRVQPRLGRFFTAEENRAPNAHAVAVLSEHVWRERFHADPAAIGRVVRFNRIAFTIVGVAPASVEHLYSSRRVDVWVPLMMEPMGRPEGTLFQRTRYGGFDLIGRLAPGATVEQAAAELKVVAARSAAEYPDTNSDESIAVVPFRGSTPLDQRESARTALLLAAVAAAVLVITCANIAGLLLSRAIARQKDLAIRFSLGATRSALVLHLMAESLLLALGASVLGLGCAYALCQLLRADEATLFTVLDVRLTPAAVLAAIAAAGVASLLFGVLPALLAARRTVESCLRIQAPTTHRSPLRTGLQVGQIALAVILLSGAALLIESLHRFTGQAGPSGDQITAFRLRPARIGYKWEAGERLNRTLLHRLSSLPGVRSAVLARVGPSRPWCCPVVVRLPEPPSVTLPAVDNNDVTGGFFSTLGIPILAGRDFDDRDRLGTTRTAIVNQTLARRLWNNRDPLGRTLLAGDVPHIVVGIVADVHPPRFGEGPVPYLYRSYWQLGDVDSRLFVHVQGTAASMIPILRRQILALDPDVHIGQESTLRQTVQRTASQQKLMTRLLEFSAAMALLLTAIGLYASLAFTVGQRRRELAIRTAVGARVGQIAGLLLRSGAILTATGLIAGIAGALASARLLASYLYGVDPLNVPTYIAVAALLAAVSLLACLVPALAAARIPPVEVLKAE